MSPRVPPRLAQVAAVALRRLALAFAVLVVGARGVAAQQFLEFRPQPPAQATGSVPVTIAFGGPVGADGGCSTSDPSAVTCTGDPYYYPYDDAVPPSALGFTVNGVDRTATLSVSGPVDTNCSYGSYQSYQCTRTYTATGSAPLTAGVTNALAATASSYGLSQTAYVNAGAGSGVTGAGLAVALVSPRLYRDPAECTLDCGELVRTISTAAYTSLNTPHAVSIMYRSGRAWPMPVVEVDVGAAPAGTAQIGLQLRTDAGAQVYIWGGGGERVRRYAAGAPNRLAVMFDAYSNTPSAGAQGADWARVYTAVVSAYDASGTLLAQQPLSARVLVDWWNGRASQYGAGWGLVGAPQFRFTGSVTDGLVIFDGSGEIGYWDAPTVSGSTYTYHSPPGDVSTVRFDASTNQLTRSWPDGSSATFGGNGFPLAVSSRLGYGQLTFNYATVSWGTVLRSITEGNGRGFTWLYRGEPGYPASEPAQWRQQTPWQISDGLGRQTGFAVDTSNDLRVTQDADGTLANSTVYYGGGAPHLMQQVTDRRGGVWHFSYDIWAKFSGVTSPPAVGSGGTQAVTTSTQTWALGVLYSADLNGGTGTLNHPADSLLSSQVRASLTGPDGLTTRIHQDQWGAPDRVEAPGGLVTTAQRDAHGNVTQSVDARGHVTSFVWNPSLPFRLDSTYDAAAKIGTRYSYEPTYSDLGRVVVNGHETDSLAYVGGRLVSHRVGGPGQSATTYDYSYQANADLRPHSISDPRGHTTTYAYTGYAPQNIVSVTDASGTTTYGYDAYGNASFSKSPLGDSTLVAYDAMNRPRQGTDGNGHTTTTAYDALYARTVTDAVGQVYRDSVNALGLPFFSYDPGGRASATTYDAAGRVATVTNRRNQTVSFGYDPTLGTLAGVTTPEGAPANTTYGTDVLGRVRWGQNAEGIDSTFTDSLGRDTLAVRRIAGLPYRYQVSSSYDSLGRRTRAWYARYTGTVGYPNSPDLGNSNPTTYAYGNAGELQSINGAQLAYNNESAPTAITYEGAFTVSRFYTAQHTLAAQHFSTSAENVLAADFTYDPLNRITARYSPAMAQRRSYTYDRAGQLAATWVGGLLNITTQSCRPGSSTGAVPGDSATTVVCTGAYDSTNTVAYAWDGVGNPAASTPAVVTPNSGNQLAGITPEQFGYDADGNLSTRYSNTLGRTTTVYTWNSLGQLVGVGASAAGPPGVTFGYDASGRRVRKSSTTNGVTTTTYFVWDGDDLAADVDATGATTAMYSYYPGGPDQPFEVQVPASSGQRYYYVTEPPGHVTGLVDYSGVAVVTYRYADPFGATVTTGGAGISGWTNRLRFGGREYDSETGLYYNRARYYDPSLRRFLSPDPTGLAGGVNWYAYAGNDPVNSRDPTGLDASCSRTYYGTVTVSVGAGTYANGQISNNPYSYSEARWGPWVCGIDPSTEFADGGFTYGMYGGSPGGGGSGRAAPAAPPNHPIFGYPGGLGVIGAQTPFIFRGQPNGYLLSESGRGIRFFGEDGIATVEYELKAGLHAHDFIDGERLSHELARKTVSAEELATARSILLRHLQEGLSALLRGRLFPGIPLFMVNPCAARQLVLCAPGPI